MSNQNENHNEADHAAGLPEAFKSEQTEEGKPLGEVVYGDTDDGKEPGLVEEGSMESFPASDAPTTMPPTTVSGSPGANPDATKNSAT